MKLKMLGPTLAVFLLATAPTTGAAESRVVQTDILDGLTPVGWVRALTTNSDLVVEVHLTDGLPEATYQIGLLGRGFRELGAIDGLTTSPTGAGHRHLQAPLLTGPVELTVVLWEDQAGVRYASEPVAVPTP